MPNIIDYVRRMADVPMDGTLAPEDALALSQLVNLNFQGVVPYASDCRLRVTLAHAYPVHGASGDVAALASVMARSLRYGDIRLCCFVDEFSQDEQKQFAALSCFEGEWACVAFRGTDARLASWKEDFDMAYLNPVPAQTAAVRYLQHVAACHSGPIYLAGHSKGGNLAVYAAAYSGNVQQQIVRVYNFDGPGVSPETYSSLDYAGIDDKIATYVPQSAVVGMLLWYDGTYTVVRSTGAGLMQHNIFTWQIGANGFITAPEITPGSLYLSRVLRALINSLPPEQLKIVVDSLYELIEGTGAHTLNELSDYLVHNPGAIAAVPQKLDGRALYALTYLLSALGPSLWQGYPAQDGISVPARP